MFRTCIGVIALAVSALGGWAVAQPPGSNEEAGWTGLTEPEEIIEARRVIMIELDRQMQRIERFTLGEQADPESIKSSATTMEAMLLAFPHLFPPTTNVFDPTVLESPTLALPAIWQDFDTFLMLGEAAEMAAATMAATDGVDALRTAGRNLRATCDACHTPFMRAYTPPEVTEEDLEFDFDSLLQGN